jgi:pyruvate, water dikinase
MQYIKNFDQLSLQDVPLVGGKNAALGEMISHLSGKGIPIPRGFAITAHAYWHYVKANNLQPQIEALLGNLVTEDIKSIAHTGSALRALFLQATMPEDLHHEIVQAYQELSRSYQQTDCDVAVRSSATAEDLPDASFAGQQETFLNIHGEENLMVACKKAFASLFTDRALVYRVEKGFDHLKVALSIGVQKMVRSDLASAGVAFSVDTETGFADVIMIDAAYGLGESIVQGIVNPDQFLVYKKTLQQGYKALIQKTCGVKKVKIVYTDHAEKPTATVPVPADAMRTFSLTDDEVLTLARMVLTIEEYYSQKYNRWYPMDIEWAKDGNDGILYIVQARPETVHGLHGKKQKLVRYELDKKQQETARLLATGLSIGQQIVTGTVRIVESAAHITKVQEGDIIVTRMTDPDWVPAMKKATGIITEQGGRTCHAAIVSRELGTPALVGVAHALSILRNGQMVTIDCAQGNTGYVYEGALAFEKKEIVLDQLPKLPVALMLNSADPARAFAHSFLPVAGVGLARLEFIITHAIGIHPLALVQFEKVQDPVVRAQIEERTALYTDKKQFFIDQLAQGIAVIAAAFYPKPVLVRLSDFKTNEYRNLLGGIYFEQEEENPMLGFRGASRYNDPRYRDAFALECAALKKVREVMGLTNVAILIPFIRTIAEAQQVTTTLQANGLVRTKQLQFFMMCEIPSNVLLIGQFSAYFDGFSIGSNDLTQLVLGVDRDSGVLAPFFDERDPAVTQMVRMAIEGARRNKKYSGICGEAPSNYPEFARFVIDCGIDSISLNPDAIIPFLQWYGAHE